MSEPVAASGVRLPIRVAPYRHQVEAFEFTCGLFGLWGDPVSTGAALLMEMGCGKSLTGIAVAGALYGARKIRRMLVVAPLSILGVWQEEFRKFAGFDYALAVLTGSAKTLRGQALAGDLIGAKKGLERLCEIRLARRSFSGFR